MAFAVFGPIFPSICAPTKPIACCNAPMRLSPPGPTNVLRSDFCLTASTAFIAATLAPTIPATLAPPASLAPAPNALAPLAAAAPAPKPGIGTANAPATLPAPYNQGLRVSDSLLDAACFANSSLYVPGPNALLTPAAMLSYAPSVAPFNAPRPKSLASLPN